MNTTAGRSGRTFRDRGAAAVEFGLLLTMISVVITGGVAALLTQIWGFDPCQVVPVCSPVAAHSPPGTGSDGQDGQDGQGGAGVPGSQPSPSPSPSDCPTPVDGGGATAPVPEPTPSDCAVAADAS